MKKDFSCICRCGLSPEAEIAQVTAQVTAQVSSHDKFLIFRGLSDLPQPNAQVTAQVARIVRGILERTIPEKPKLVQQTSLRAG